MNKKNCTKYIYNFHPCSKHCLLKKQHVNRIMYTAGTLNQYVSHWIVGRLLLGWNYNNISSTLTTNWKISCPTPPLPLLPNSKSPFCHHVCMYTSTIVKFKPVLTPTPCSKYVPTNVILMVGDFSFVQIQLF